ncbi:MAG: DUF3078 domain-containing protein [Bacteroidales bacterium]|jgi:hypothetical protein|nr:DUF3078 domain-containing protein [Bacteroidales bacterium]MCB9027736.1 DUF3078 domain-containing protein [Bacteroidales bacterium]MDD3736220.1 DUF3078 domain-containing protein [Bacteroidales bacterium]NLD64667.1 DUF3078 domain-containing protein [Bacteroidales bacterium]HNT92296.1 DUF3078 domain-containing protein [Bacteroidales bacterium]
MRKITIVLSLALALTGINPAAFGQDADTTQGWHNSGVFSLNMSQANFTNWAAGGQNSLALNGLVNLGANYRMGKSAWDNALIIGYGKMVQKGNDLGWMKTDDRIDFQSKYGREATEKWFYSGLMSFKTQMDNGYNYPDTDNKISGLLSPAYLLFSLGMDYKPNPNFSVFLSPLTSKNTIVMDDVLSMAGAFGVEPGKNFRPELGAYANIAYKKDEIVKNVNFMTKLDLFTNYLKNPQNIDISWEALLVLKVNEFISATVNTHLLYDDDILIKIDEGSEGDPVLGKRAQFKEVIGVGFTYKFIK